MVRCLLVVVVSSAILDPSIADERRHVPTPTVVTFFILNTGGVALSAYLLLHYFVRERDRMKATLDRVHRLLLREQEKSERLLLNVLPTWLSPCATPWPGTPSGLAFRSPFASGSTRARSWQG